MSRYGFDREENRENAAFGTEFPLPSYEQACATVNEIGFKRDVQFTPLAQSSGSDVRDERINLRDERGELDDVSSRHKLIKQCGIAISILAIIISLLITAIIVSGKISRCTTSVPQMTDLEYETEISYLKNLNERCIKEKESLQRQYTITGRRSDAEIKELINYRQDSEKQKSDLNTIISDLRNKLSQLTSENAKLKLKLVFANHDDEKDTTKPISTSTPSSSTTTTTEDVRSFPPRFADSRFPITSSTDFETMIKILMEKIKEKQKRIYKEVH